MQCWGKALSHREGRNFLNVTGQRPACNALTRRLTRCRAVAFFIFSLSSHCRTGTKLSALTSPFSNKDIKQYAGATLPAGYWEGFLLPYWVKNYRSAQLDAYLAEGEVFWHMDHCPNLCTAVECRMVIFFCLFYSFSTFA